MVVTDKGVDLKNKRKRMTSREFILRLENAMFMSQEMKKHFKQVENDLEILELIKKHFMINRYGEIIFKEIDYNDTNDLDKIISWLRKKK